MSRFAKIFAAARGRCTLIPYLTVGDPSLAASRAVALALTEAGADILELGVPFSDPVADGPVIQAASQRALAQGVRLADVLELARAVRREAEVGLLLFSYYNPVLRYGLEALARDAAAAGCDGVLITDLIPEEAAAYRTAMGAVGLDTVFLAAPTSTPERLAAIAAASSGFIYAVSRLGVTGAAVPPAEDARTLVAALRLHTRLPIAVGFGLADARQIDDVAGYADGAVVGSALVRTLAAAPGREATAAKAFLQGLRHGNR